MRSLSLFTIIVCLLLIAAMPAFAQDQKNFSVQAAVYDPANTNLVAAQWIKGAGCPTSTVVAIYPSTTPTSSYGDPACPTGDKDKDIWGLFLQKTGPIGNNAAAGARIHIGAGQVPTEFGYDIRADSHCGAGAPRFNLVTSDGVFHFIGACANGTQTTSGSTEWIRVRFDPYHPSQALPPVATGVTIKYIDITFDEPGQAVLDNIDINGVLIGKP